MGNRIQDLLESAGPDTDRAPARRPEARRDTVGDGIHGVVQRSLPHHLLSALMYRATRVRARWWKNWQIRWFVRRYGVNLGEAQSSRPEGYPDFNTFFTRALRAGARPMEDAPEAVGSPADGAVSEAGPITGDTLVQAKGRGYTVGDLLADDRLAERFRDGSFVTIYLSPRDYHRVHMPLAGALREMTYVPGRLFSVNPATARTIPRLFARNERVVSVFDTAAGAMAIVLVGAVFVGGIEHVWSGPVTPVRPRRTDRRRYPSSGDGCVNLERGQEMGRFNMGSTVIVLLPAGAVRWAEALAPGSPVRQGSTIGHLATP